MFPFVMSEMIWGFTRSEWIGIISIIVTIIGIIVGLWWNSKRLSKKGKQSEINKYPEEKQSLNRKELKPKIERVYHKTMIENNEDKQHYESKKSHEEYVQNMYSRLQAGVPVDRNPMRRNKQKEILTDEFVTVESGEKEWFEYDLKMGDEISGLIYEENYDFNVYFLNKKRFSDYLNGAYYEDSIGEENTYSFSLDEIIEKDDTYYLVLDTYGKQNDREIKVKLEKI